MYAGALDDAGVLKWVTAEKLRNGNIHTDDIPKIIVGAIDYLMGIAGTVSIIFIIIGAYKLAFWSLDNDTGKGKETIILALSWLVLSSTAWLIFKVVIDNFS